MDTTADPEALRDAVRASVDAFRASADPDPIALGEELAPLAEHASAKVRQAVAEACDLFPEALFDRVLASLAGDSDHYVRAAAERAAGRRAARRKAHAREDEHEQALAELLDAIERKSGKAARRTAERAVKRGTEAFVRKLHHEVSKIAAPLEFAVNRLRAEVAKPDLDRAALGHHVEVAANRLAYLWAVVERAREATGSVTPRFGDESLAAILDEARAQLAQRVGERGARLRVTIDVDRALRLHADRHALLQALQNFLQNAVEAYDDEAPSLDVAIGARAKRAGSQVVITIADRGAGMTEDQLARVFVPFGSRKPGGTGVGMLIARTMIEEAHGGSLAIESTRGAGTTITIVLPVRQPGVRAQAAGGAPTEAT